MKSRPKYPQPLPPDLHPGTELQPSARVPTPHPGFDSLSEWFHSPPALLPSGLNEAEVTQMWRTADLDNNDAIGKIEQHENVLAGLFAVLHKLDRLSERLRNQRDFSQMCQAEILEIDNE